MCVVIFIFGAVCAGAVDAASAQTNAARSILLVVMVVFFPVFDCPTLTASCSASERSIRHRGLLLSASRGAYTLRTVPSARAASWLPGPCPGIRSGSAASVRRPRHDGAA